MCDPRLLRMVATITPLYCLLLWASIRWIA
jgi:hypothetical protein